MRGKETWTLEKIKEGFEGFLNQNGRYPTALEIDSFNGLPSSRQIQRRWPGGLKQLREILGLDIKDYTKGAARSLVATNIGKRGLLKEREVQDILISRFGEMFVHEQKPYDNFKGRLDFMVYTKQKKFGVDVFYAKDKFSFVGCLNSKSRDYGNLPYEVILLNMNDDLSQLFNIDVLISNKKNQLASNLKLMDFSRFKKYIEDYKALEAI